MTAVPHFQPKTGSQYVLMMAVLVGLSVLCIGGVLWMKAQFARQIPPVLQKASALLEDHNYAEAQGVLETVILEIERSQGADAPALARHLDLLAAAYSGLKKEPEAEKALRRSFEIRRKQLGADHPETINSGDKLAQSLMSQGKYSDAEPLLRKTLAHREAYYGPDNAAIMPALNHLADLFLHQKRYADAEPLASRAVTIGRSTVGLLPPAYADSMHLLAATLAGEGKFAEAAPLYEAAVMQKVKLLPDQPHIPPKPGQISHGDFADLCKAYAAVLRQLGREKEARELEGKAESVLHPRQ